jgi:signal transduction histidine kinase/CheY-like chemotaxis protein
MPRSLDFPAGGGRVGALMRDHDWSVSPLGDPQDWPESLRTVVDLLLHSRFPMFVAWGPELGFLYNDPYAEILGGKHPAALGRKFQDIWSEIWADISPLIDSAMAGEASYHEDLPLLMNRRGFDEQTWFTFSYSPVRDDSGGVAGMFCACFETTSRILTERALRDSEGRLRELNETLERRVDEALAERKLLVDIVEGTNAVVVVADLNYRLLAVNRAGADEFETVYGVRPRVGDHLIELLDGQPEHQAEVQALWGRALAGEEFSVIAPFGNPLRARHTYDIRFSQLRDRAGKLIGAYQFVYDVTERVRDQERLHLAEAALRQAQKMESIGQLTGGVAHDFNNLLAVIATGLHLLGRDITPEQRQRTLDSMRRAVTRGTGLTRHLLAFSRRRPLNAEAIDLEAHLRGMRDMFDSLLGGHTRVNLKFGPALWPVEVDAGELELAIINLCVNARDAMPDGGAITIGVENVQDVSENGTITDLVKLTITDHGTGMTEAVAARAFEPFFTTKEVSKGSGLGLPQVYGFAQQSGGRVAIESKPGDGTSVTLWLPRTMKPVTATPDSVTPESVNKREAPKRAVTARGHLLLVEDDQEVSALSKEMLTSLGFKVTHVSSAAAALDALAGNRAINVVLSDIMMPGGVSGLELAREIKRRYPAIPVTLTTGNAEAAAGMREGEFGLLLKPYSLEALAEALGFELESDATSDRVT